MLFYKIYINILKFNIAILILKKEILNLQLKKKIFKKIKFHLFKKLKKIIIKLNYNKCLILKKNE